MEKTYENQQLARLSRRVRATVVTADGADGAGGTDESLRDEALLIIRRMDALMKKNEGALSTRAVQAAYVSWKHALYANDGVLSETETELDALRRSLMVSATTVPVSSNTTSRP